MAQYTIEIEGLDRLRKAFQQSPKNVIQGLSDGIKTSVNIIRPIMVRNAPVKTTKLRRNIYARTSGLEGQVGPDLSIVPYALYVHEGTRAHEIRPVTKQALYWEGAPHPVKLVHHPGTKPNPFVQKTAEEMTEPINKIFKGIADRIVNNLTK